MSTTISATYSKLKSGEWGIRVPGATREGQTVTVTTKAGAAKTETVARVLWTGNGVSICAIAQRSRGRWSGCSCGSIEDQPRASDCRQCQYDNE